MTFISIQERIIPGEGSKTSPICIIGEAGGEHENRTLRPFVGPAGGVLETCLHAAGLLRKDCYITNVVKIRPKNNDIAPYYKSTNGKFTPAGQEWVESLYEELATVRSNVLVPLGSTALAAITGYRSISKYRGYVVPSIPAIGNRKVVPAYHPAASLRGQYILRYYITADLKKAKIESTFPDIRRPDRKIIVPETIADCLEWVGILQKQERLSIDIEVVNFEVSAIGFAIQPDLAISIPFYHEHWTEDEEVMLWKLMHSLLTNPKIVKIFQNGIFDVGFLVTRCGIMVSGPFEDTMIAHHIQYPEMLKGLEFLVSMYCGAQEYYKDMVKWDNIKKEA